MSKRKESKEVAVFELEPDGFSIHTFELSKRLTKHEYHHMKKTLYDDPATEIYQEYKGHHYCGAYRRYGVRIYLEHNQSEGGFDTYFVRMVINPRVLIEPGCSYLGILPPEESSIKKLKKTFKKLFKDAAFDNDLSNYYLSRVDLCTNIRCDNDKLFRELVRVLRKLSTPPKYERKFYKHEDKKKANQYNKHYLRFCCGTHELVIYDKTYQLRDGNLIIGYENLPEGVLRYEVHCERAYIRQVEKKADTADVLEILRLLMNESEDRLTDHFSRCFPDTAFVQKKELERRIKESGFKRENKAAMLELASRLQRTQSVDKALEKMQGKGYDTSGVLDRFTKLGVSPIPLWKRFCAKSLPGPVELLRDVSEGIIEVEYVKVKYK